MRPIRAAQVRHLGNAGGGPVRLGRPAAEVARLGRVLAHRRSDAGLGARGERRGDLRDHGVERHSAGARPAGGVVLSVGRMITLNT